MTAVDVIVPCYNYGRYLERCVGSVLDQQGCTVRVLIIDDCSTDDSLATAALIAARDPRVTVIAHAQNRGHIATYNEGIAWVRSPCMLLLSADDMLAPGALGRAVALMETRPSIAFVYGRAIKFTDEAALTAPAAEDDPQGVRIQSGEAFIAALCREPSNPVETATVVVRSALQHEVGGYLPELPHSGDLEMWLRLAAYGDVAEVEAVQAFTRIHTNNMRHGYAVNRMIGDYRQRIEAFRCFFAGAAGRLQECASLERAARMALSEEILWAAIRTFEEGARRDAATLKALARTAWPDTTATSLWWKLRARQLLGRHVWDAVQPCLEGVRRLRPSGSRRAA